MPYLSAAGDVERHTLPEGDAGTAATLRLMRGAITAAKGLPAVRRVAEAVVSEVSPDAVRMVERIWEFMRSAFRFVPDPVALEWLKRPEIHLADYEARGYMAGDCDDATMIVATLAESVGLPTRLVAQAIQTDAYDHVLPEIEIHGVWHPVEITGSMPLFEKRLAARELIQA